MQLGTILGSHTIKLHSKREQATRKTEQTKCRENHTISHSLYDTNKWKNHITQNVNIERVLYVSIFAHLHSLSIPDDIYITKTSMQYNQRPLAHQYTHSHTYMSRASQNIEMNWMRHKRRVYCIVYHTALPECRAAEKATTTTINTSAQTYTCTHTHTCMRHTDTYIV